jgi:hypothetical protein
MLFLSTLVLRWVALYGGGQLNCLNFLTLSVMEACLS